MCVEKPPGLQGGEKIFIVSFREALNSKVLREVNEFEFSYSIQNYSGRQKYYNGKLQGSLKKFLREVNEFGQSFGEAFNFHFKSKHVCVSKKVLREAQLLV